MCTFIQDIRVNSSVWKGDSDQYHAYYLFTWHRGRQILGWRTSRFMEEVVSTSKGTVLLASARCQLHRSPGSFIRWVRPNIHIVNNLEVLRFLIFPPRWVFYRWGYRGTLEHQQSGHATLNFPPPSSLPNKCTLSTIKRQLRHKRHPWSGWTVVMPEGQSLTQYDLSHLIGPSSWS